MVNQIAYDVLHVPDLFFDWEEWSQEGTIEGNLHAKAREINVYLQRNLPRILQLRDGDQSELSWKLHKAAKRLYGAQRTLFAARLAGVTVLEAVDATIDALESPDEPSPAYLKFAVAKYLAEKNFGESRAANARQSDELELGSCSRFARETFVMDATCQTLKKISLEEGHETEAGKTLIAEFTDAKWSCALEVFSDHESEISRCIEQIDAVRARLKRSSCVIL